MFWRRVSLLALPFWAGWLFSQAPGKTGVDRLIYEPFARNREPLAVQQRVAEARGLLRQAGVRPVPIIETNGASESPLGTVGDEEYSVGYSQPIETGGERPNVCS